MTPYTYTPLDLLKEAKAITKGRGHYCGHAIKIHDNGTSLVVYYTPRNPEAEIKTSSGFPSTTHPGRFERSMAL